MLLSSRVKVIAYGDQRFHDHFNYMIANPKARVALVDKIAAERPDAIQMSGDVPFKGTDRSDYDSFRNETKAWRAPTSGVYPALGNTNSPVASKRELQSGGQRFRN